MKTHTNKHIAYIIIGGIILCGSSFYGGIKYDQSQNVSKRGQFAAGQFGGERQGAGMTRAGGRNFGGAINGEIIAADSASVTVKDRNGGSKIIFLASSTEITKSVAGTASDLIVGQNIMAMGTPNSDRSITAQTVSVRPAMPQGTPSRIPPVQ